MADAARSDVTSGASFRMKHGSSQLAFQDCQACQASALSKSAGAPAASTLWQPGTFHPNLAAQPETYLAEQLNAYRSGKRSNEIMSVIAKPLTDAEITNLAAWFASIAIEAKPRR